MPAMLRTKRPRARTVFSLVVVASLIGTGLWAAPSAVATTQAAPAQPTGGVVAAWGGNGSSQLGATTTDACPGKNLCSTTALLVSNLDGVSIQSVSAGGLHSLALASDGTVWAWGSNYFNQVGIGSNSPSACTPPNGNCQVATPSQVGGLSNIQAVAAGGTHSLALTDDGHVWAWGANYLGQLGNGSFKGSATPVEVGGTANPLSGVTAIAAGGTHSLALKSDGTVWAWGGDIFGQLGLGKGKLSSDVPVQVSGLTGVTAIAAGGLHSLALDSTGAMWAWGANFAGQLGDGGYKNHNAPEQVGPSGVTAIAAGGLHSLAISMFGDASQNQAGTSQPASAKNKRNRKHVITPQPRVGSGSTLYAWGYNRDGELGLGYTTNTGCRCVTDPQVVEGAFGAADIAAGGVQSLALMSDGTVLSWGSNGTGELGNDSTTSSASPVQVDGLSGIDTSASAHNQIAAGGLHNLALGPAPNVTTPTAVPATDTPTTAASQTPDATQTASAQETAAAQQAAVDAAQTAAAEAQGTANAADTAAANAQGTAVAAQETAAAAGADDSNAQTAAAVAQTAASIAQTAAANAQTAAAAQQAAAQQTADAAAANATSAAGTVAAAATAVAQAQQTVSAAQTALAQVIQIQQTAIAAIETALAGGGGSHSSAQSHVALPSAQQLVAAQQTVTAAQAVLAAQQSSGIRPADLVSAQQTATAVVGAISSAQTALAAAQAVLAAAQQTYTAAQATGTAAAAQFAAPAQTAAAIAQATGTAAAQTVSAVQTGAAGQNGQNAATQTAAAQIISANQTAAAAARQTAGVVQATAEAQLAAAAATANAAATAFAAAQTQAAGIGVAPANTPVTPPQNTPVTPPQNTPVTPPQNTAVTLPAVSVPASTKPTVVPIVLPQPTASVSRPKPKPTIRITLPKQGAFSGRTLIVTVLTSPKVRVSVSLQVFGSKTVVVGKGKKKHKVVQRIVIYKQTRTGITGLHGAFVAHLPVTIKVKTKPIQAVITASARIGKTALIGTARVLIHPALKAVHAAPVKPAGKHSAKTKKK